MNLPSLGLSALPRDPIANKYPGKARRDVALSVSPVHLCLFSSGASRSELRPRRWRCWWGGNQISVLGPVRVRRGCDADCWLPGLQSHAAIAHPSKMILFQYSCACVLAPGCPFIPNAYHMVAIVVFHALRLDSSAFPPNLGTLALIGPPQGWRRCPTRLPLAYILRPPALLLLSIFFFPLSLTQSQALCFAPTINISFLLSPINVLENSWRILVQSY